MTAALILAAGSIPEESSRKPTDAIGGASSIKRILMVFRQAGIKKIVVITGYDANALERHCAHMGAVFLRNDEYETGDMFSSVKVGLKYLEDKCTKTFITPANTPFFTVETVRSMDDMDESVVIPVYNNKTGHPLLLSKNCFDTVMKYDGPDGLGAALSSGGVARKYFDVNDKGILLDFRKASDFDEILENHSLRQIRPEADIKLIGENEFFGPEALQLLHLTEEAGYLKHAARRMGVSYSKAWRLITNAEEQLGFLILERKRGGRQGGGSEITEKGLEFLRSYELFISECVSHINSAFEKYFKKQSDTLK